MPDRERQEIEETIEASRAKWHESNRKDGARPTATAWNCDCSFFLPTGIGICRDVLGFEVWATSEAGRRLQLGVSPPECC